MRKSILIGALALAVSGIAFADDYPRDGSGNLLQATGQPCWKTPYFTADPAVSTADELVYCNDAHWEKELVQTEALVIKAVTISAFFDTGSSTISEQQEATLVRILTDTETIGTYTGFHIIMGSTDDRGDTGYNRRLGIRRAYALHDIMIANGFRSPAIGTYGETNAVAVGDQPAYRKGVATGTGTFVELIITEEDILVIDTL